MIVFSRIQSSSHPMYVAALELYSISFPTHEQRNSHMQEKALANEKYHFNLILDENIFVGIILYWETSDFIYVEHFCINPEIRGKKYGQATLELLRKQGKTIILEIDPPIDEISLRRKGFYKRAGYIENEFAHIHPPYNMQNVGHALMIMSYPLTLSHEAYSVFNSFLKDVVMS